MSFSHPVDDFYYKPHVSHGTIRRGEVVLLSSLNWYDDETGRYYVVPEGFVFDLASLPWWIGFALTKLGRHQRAACLHDWFYVNKTNGKRWSDKQFRLAMDEDHTKGWRKWLAWSGVAAGGWFAWWKESEVIIVKSDAE